MKDETSIAASVPCLFLCTKDDAVPWEDYQTLQSQMLKQQQSRQHGHHQVVIMEEGGHSPFYGSTKKEYFDHIYKFLIENEIL
jgi:hypothetical protein